MQRPLRARLPVEADGEAVGLVPDPLDELEHRRGARERHRQAPPPDEEQFLALGEAGHRLIAQAQLLEGLDRGAQLALAPVDEDEVRQILPLLQETLVPPAHDLAHGSEVVRGPREALHPELAVVGLLRKPLLEDHHRRHDVGALDIGDVEALDASRLDLEVEDVTERPEDLLGLLSRVLPLQLEGQARVADHEVQQAQLLPPLRGADPDPRAPALAQPGLEQLPIGQVHGEQDLAGDVPPPGVELLEGRGQHGLRLGEAIEEKALPRHDLAVPNRESLERRPLAFDVGGKEVPFFQLGGGDLLRRLEALEGPDLVAEGGRLFEALLPGHPLHVRAQAAHHLLRAPLEEETGVVARLPVPLERAHLGDARGDAALDLVLQAGAGPAAVQFLLAGADPEELADEPGGLAAEAGRDVGPPVGVAVLRGPAHHVEARVILLEGEAQVGVVLVVPKADVVERLVALDEVVLEGQGLHLGVGDHELEIGDVLDHAALVEFGRTRGLEVRPDPVAQNPGLADVDDLAPLALEQVDPGAVRELIELVGEGHGSIIACRAPDGPVGRPAPGGLDRAEGSGDLNIGPDGHNDQTARATLGPRAHEDGSSGLWSRGPSADKTCPRERQLRVTP